MRVFNSCVDLINETTREVFSRGVIVFDKTVQGKIVGREEYEQKELIGYSYRLTNFNDKVEMLDWARKTFNKSFLNKEIAEAWFKDFFNTNNPDSWWIQNEELKKYWEEFGIEEDGKFSYTYGQRLNDFDQLNNLIKRLKLNLYSRGSIVYVGGREDCSMINRRIPCTIAYQFLVRKDYNKDKVNLIVYQRSCDLVNFFALDVYKAIRLLEYISNKLNLEPGFMIHFIGSLHCYKKDVPEDRRW